MDKKIELWKLVSGYKHSDKEHYNVYGEKELDCRNLLETLREFENQKVSDCRNFKKLDIPQTYLDMPIYEQENGNFYIHYELQFIIIGQLFRKYENEINSFIAEVKQIGSFSNREFKGKSDKEESAIMFLYNCIGAIQYDPKYDNMRINIELIEEIMGQYMEE